MVVRSQLTAEPAATPARGAASAHRILGVLGMLGSPFLFLSFAANGFQEGDSNRLGAALGLLFTLGWFSSVLGLWTLRAAGDRLPGKIVLGLELVGVVLASLFQVYEFVAPGSTSLLYTITDAAWPLSMLVLLLVGIAVLRARVLQGWMRFVPILCPLWIPITIAAAALGERAGDLGSISTAIGWFLLGYVVWRGGTIARG